MSTKFTTSSLVSNEKAYRQLVEELGQERVRLHQPIGELLPLGLGGEAEIVVEVSTVPELLAAARCCLACRVPYQLIAGGTGVLASDVGFPGVLIRNKTAGLLFLESERQALCDGGVATTALVTAAANRRYGGIEYLSALPGSVGGALATNAAVDGKTLATTALRAVTVFLPNQSGGEVATFSPNEYWAHCRSGRLLYSYAFQPIILTLRLQLTLRTEREIVEQLQRYRSAYRENQSRPNALSHIFTQPLESLENRAKSIGRGFRWHHRNSPMLLVDRSAISRSEPVRRAIDALAGVDNSDDGAAALELRLRYLGYWPEDHEATHRPNAESI